MLGLVPKGLVQALLELGVPGAEVEQLADDVSALLQSALTRELWLHARGVAKSREWATLYAKHVLGKQPRRPEGRDTSKCAEAWVVVL